ncbi:MAG TPA: hypothetical protein VHX11_04165 [Acidobacteriaceae bacterium]|jgi:hypothetical protein|nr:hypothetical protein [Acidobacteriaceae bacterium]
MPSISSAYPNLERAVLRVRIVLNLLGALLLTALVAGFDNSEIMAHTASKELINIALIVPLAVCVVRTGMRVVELRRLNRALGGQPRPQRLRESSACGD